MDIISNSNDQYTVDIIVVDKNSNKNFKEYPPKVLPKYTDYNGMIEFSKALRKYYEVSTPESRVESYKPWLSDNVIDTTGPWYKGHRKLHKEDNIVKDVVYVLAKTLHEEVNKNHMKRNINSIDRIYNKDNKKMLYEDDIHLYDQQDPEPLVSIEKFRRDLLNKEQADIDKERAYLNQPKDYVCKIDQNEIGVLSKELKIEKRMQKITIAVTAVF